MLAQLDAKHTDVSSYQLQAQISAEHAKAYTFTTTDWLVIARCYDQLYQLNPTPVVHLNGAVAIAQHLVSGCCGPLMTRRHLSTIMQHVLDCCDAAALCNKRPKPYKTALAPTTNTTEYNFLCERLAAVNTELGEP